MDWQGWLTIFITAGVFITLVSSSRLGPDLVLMGALLLLSISGVLNAEEALSGFSNSGLTLWPSWPHPGSDSLS